jgi:DUF4097 and DUF4098 domain-containing protein YvlB
MIRQTAISIGALGIVSACGCSVSWQDANKLATYKTPISSEMVGLANSVSIETRAGDVLLESTQAEPRIVGKIHATTQARADATTISTVVNGDTLEISVNWPDGKRKSSEGCDLLVYLPTMTGVSIDTSAGDVFVKDMAGHMDIHSSAGDIEIHDHNGAVTARGSAGDIDFWDVNGVVDVKTSAGQISLHRVGAPATVKTSAGDIYVILNQGSTGTLSASTTVGDVELAGTGFKSSGSVQITPEGPTSRFESSAGDIEVIVESE